ncbi:hypothetical protein Prudu_001363 [Prunus dulcis]|uniref:Uncharacterized protein n=1 Tax=Prunus dulcis TaxID=3755 RepID=A0A4Y1QNE2_PRUDU|nr:hypothetical protein Prudu_001363 [Prunus dulcis]
MDHLLLGPGVSQALASQLHQWRSLLAPGGVTAKKITGGPCRQLKTAKVTWVTNSCINIGYDERHWAALMAELHSSLAHDIGYTNYNLEDLDDESLAYVNRLFAETYKQ